MTLTVDGAPMLAFLLASLRVVAWLVIVPPFATRAFPTTAKVVLALGLSMAMAPALADDPVPVELWSIAVVGLTQVAIGAGLGYLTMLMLSVISAAGSLLDVFGGFALAQGFDPLGQNSSTVIGQLHNMLATMLLFVSGGYLVVVAGLLRTFEVLPLGSAPSTTDGIGLVTAAFSLFIAAAVQVALPMVAVLFVADLGLALMTKIAPQLNAIQVMFPAKIGLTLLLVGLSFTVLPDVTSRMVDHAIRVMSAFATGG
ncbi:flagellar biosynthetic protein FliR [Nocardioides sp. GY 10127]|uniref:flagellar biosynthetic protein FliR n=1 Tax=Nocardioides sp. GY 10127 TaxID=2569762 RepID=UPI0010A83DFC|nr:flagellar biosynthetic protein FliR [Nocardioides sp. GY 10127]TIC78643.1 flagellar biosynthetic protein FliR [Nocardioides sp. GY 10127]